LSQSANHLQTSKILCRDFQNRAVFFAILLAAKELHFLTTSVPHARQSKKTGSTAGFPTALPVFFI